MQPTLNGETKQESQRVCAVCGLEYSPRAENQRYCSVPCRKHAMNEITKNHFQVAKLRIFEIYDNKCNHCDETDPIVLSLDHIEPVGKKRLATSVIFTRILSNPELHKKNYQLLCRNCNWRKMILNNERNTAPPFAYRHELNRLEMKINELTKKINTKNGNTPNGDSFYNTFEEIISRVSTLKDQIPLKSNGDIHSGRCIRWMKEQGLKIKSRDEPALITEIRKLIEIG